MNLARLASIAVLIVALGSDAFLSAAPLHHELGDGLHYLRVSEIPADLSSAPSAPRALVLDLRAVEISETAANAFLPWLRTRAQTRAPVFVLLNAETGRSLLLNLAQLSAHPGLLTFGSADHAAFAPDIEVKVDRETESRILREIEQGQSVQRFVAEPAKKDRFDEAALMRDRRGEAEGPELLDPADSPPEERSARDEAPAPLVDRTLQSAIQTYRALRALDRL